jgi:hypothetical protein
MMPPKKLLRMVVANTLRSPRHFILSAFGIVIGIGAFVLFLALTQRAGEVLEKVFPIDEVQVVAPTVAVGPLDATKRLDDTVVKRILARPEITAAIPRMNIAFPASLRGDFEGKEFRLELAGFADGVDASFAQDDPRSRDLFRDWDAVKDDPNRIACVPPPVDPEDPVRASPRAPRKKRELMTSDDRYGPGGQGPDPAGPFGIPPALPKGFQLPPPGGALGAPPPPPPAPPAPAPDAAGSGSAVAAGSADAGSATGTATPIVVSPPAEEYTNPCPNPDRYYCDDTERVCKHRVPVVVSPTVVELYNTRFAKSHGMPAANEDLIKSLIEMRGVSAMRFSIGLNNTVIAGSGGVTKKRPRRVEGVIVGISNRAMQLGMTMPIEYLERWNREYMGEQAATAYSSIIAKVKDSDKIAPFVSWLKDVEDLRIEDSKGEQFATVIFVIRLLFLIISIAILVVAVINIGHNFFVQVSERRREIGIMRAVGATQTDVLLIVLGEAAMVGIVGGLIGVALAVGIGTGWNVFAEANIPKFPFKPTSWFDFKPWIWGSALGFSTLFCILGGYLPARRAAKMEPAQALAQN